MQVTRGEDEVLADLRERVEDPETLSVEIVRYSEKDLATFADRLEALPGSDSWAYGVGNANGRMEVEVPGDAERVRRRLAEIIDPCAFVVKGNVAPMRPT